MNNSRFTNLGLVAIFVLLMVPGLALAQATANANGNGQGSQVMMPALIWTVGGGDVTNSGGNGGIDNDAVNDFSVLIVYRNGLAVATTFNSSNGGNGTNGNGNVQTFSLSQNMLNQLTRDIRSAGGLRAGGSLGTRTGNEPLNTITIFQNAGGSNTTIANTFSFYGTPTGARGRVLSTLQNFANNNLGLTDFGNGTGSGTGTGQ